MTNRPLEILMVEDNPTDVVLAREAFKQTGNNSVLRVAKDGIEAMEFLGKKGRHANAAKPDLIILDLNLPRKDGREALAEIKTDPDLKRIPVVIFSTSNAEPDIVATYNLGANCYIVKPMELKEYFQTIRSAESFWLTTVTRSPT